MFYHNVLVEKQVQAYSESATSFGAYSYMYQIEYSCRFEKSQSAFFQSCLDVFMSA